MWEKPQQGGPIYIAQKDWYNKVSASPKKREASKLKDVQTQ